MNNPIIAAGRTNNITHLVRDVLLIADELAIFGLLSTNLSTFG